MTPELIDRENPDLPKTVKTAPAGCLILACGNTLRSDDGVGPFLAEWAEERFREKKNVRVVARQQWTPDLAVDIAAADSVLFVDCSVDSGAGRVGLAPVAEPTGDAVPATHQINATALLGLAHTLYGSRSAHAMLLTVGAGSTEMGERFSECVAKALPRAQGVLEKAVLRFLAN